MTDTTLHPHNLAQEAQNVSTALLELAVATRRLAVALWAALTHRKPVCSATTARQEAEKLRAYADSLHRADPRYAQDLYAAANRHELAANAG
jgi:hypothetical protein